MCTYHGVAKEVEPKIAALSEARAAQVEATLDAARARFEAALADKARLEEDASNTRKRADAAESLLHALAGEERRWQAQAAESARAVTCLTGDCLVAAAFLSYAGPFPREYRDRLVRETLVEGAERAGVPLTPDFEPVAFLVDEAEAGEWAAQGLPPDELSLQNGTLVARAPRAPLLIDPQGQGVAWLLARESGSNSSPSSSSSSSSSSAVAASSSSSSAMRVVQPGEKNFRAVLEDCLTTGTPLLIDWRSGNCDDLDPALDPVLEGRFVRRAGGSSLSVTLGDRDVDVAPGFRIAIATPSPSPKLTPELCARVSAVDFTVTQAGLEDQLLARLVLAERRELERGRRALVAGAARERRAIKQLGDDLLARLSSSAGGEGKAGSLLDDAELVGVLAITKRTAAEAAGRLAAASEATARLKAAADEFRPAARRGAILYSEMDSFGSAGVNPMYATGLAQFCMLYDVAIADSAAEANAASESASAAASSSAADGDASSSSSSSSSSSLLPPPQQQQSPAERVAAISSRLTASVHSFVQRGLFEGDKLVFSALLAMRVGIDDGRVPAEEVDEFLRGGGDGSGGVEKAAASSTSGSSASSVSASPSSSSPTLKKRPRDWLPEEAWREACSLAAASSSSSAAAAAASSAAAVSSASSSSSTLSLLRDLPESLTRVEAAWRAWYDSPTPESSAVSPLPDCFDAKISPFQRLALVKALREDRTLPALARFVGEILGREFSEPTPSSIEAALDEAALSLKSGGGGRGGGGGGGSGSGGNSDTASTSSSSSSASSSSSSTMARPIICLLSRGSDPSSQIDNLARRRRARVLGVSLGQGQEPAARRALASAAAEGGWVVLQNAHLGLGFMPEVESFVLAAMGSSSAAVGSSSGSGGGGSGGNASAAGGKRGAASAVAAAAAAGATKAAAAATSSISSSSSSSPSSSTHPSFRLFITVAPTEGFPQGLLRAAVKVTNEAPSGVRAGLRAAYAPPLSQDVLDGAGIVVPGRGDKEGAAAAAVATTVTVSASTAALWRSLLFSASFLHSVVLERRRFGAIGCTTPYDFGRDDLAAVTSYLRRHVGAVEGRRRRRAAAIATAPRTTASSPAAAAAASSSSLIGPAWDEVRYMVGAIQYGGRVTAEADQRVMDCVVSRYLCPGVVERAAAVGGAEVVLFEGSGGGASASVAAAASPIAAAAAVPVPASSSSSSSSSASKKGNNAARIETAGEKQQQEREQNQRRSS